MEKKYYDGTKILSLKDINGKTPEIYIVTTNRTGGKTTYFNRLLVNRFLKQGKKFGLLYRYTYEIDDAADKFFKDIQNLFFPDYTMTSKIGGNGFFRRLYLNDQECGYAIAINSSDQVKKHSHLYSDIDSLLFDEFQSESGDYCPKEIMKFQSVHTSIARGQNKQVRYVPVYMLSNPVSLLNPYYVAFGISHRLQKDTKFIRGNGWVMEQGYIPSAADAQMKSAFNQAFMNGNDNYLEYSAQGIYLNDNVTFIDKPKGKFRYVANIKYENKYYSVKEYYEQGIVYIDTSVDMQFNVNISATLDDHTVNHIMMHRGAPIIAMLKNYFDRGCIRFRNIACKECLFALITY